MIVTILTAYEAVARTIFQKSELEILQTRMEYCHEEPYLARKLSMFLILHIAALSGRIGPKLLFKI